MRRKRRNGIPAEVLASVPMTRRAFVKRLAGAAFALPVMSSFVLDAPPAWADHRSGHKGGYPCGYPGWYLGRDGLWHDSKGKRKARAEEPDNNKVKECHDDKPKKPHKNHEHEHHERDDDDDDSDHGH